MERNTGKKGKLSLQLFVTTFIVMTVIIAIIMLLQYLFFDELYTRYKTNVVGRKVDELAEMIENDELDYVELNNIVDDFLLTHNTYISIVDEDGIDYSKKMQYNQNWYTISGQTEDGRNIVFTISEYDIYSNQYTEINGLGTIDADFLQSGNEYYILYDYITEEKVKVYLISDSDNVEFYQDDFVNFELITIKSIDEATLEEINQNIYFDYFIYQGYAEASIFVEDIVYVAPDNIQNTIIQVTDKDGEQVYIDVIVSLENVEDAAAALLSYYPYFLALALVCALIVSFVYSKKVSKPITQISRISNNMAQLNLDEKAGDKWNNEIGVLGENLNTLADNLHDALSDLKRANTQLLEDIEHKKQQEESRKEFVANVSHELKTPLGVIRCYAESLKDGMTTKPEGEYYDDILAETEKMTRLVMEMLELSKVESGDLKLHKSDVDLKGIIDDNVLLHGMAAKDKKMNIIIQGTFPMLHADSSKMDSVISNIVGNAVLYGKVSSDIEIEGLTKDNIFRMSVSNVCNGISQSEAEKFFDRFYVGNKSRSQRSTGLGLSICAGILKAHGFDYGIDSDGEVVTVWFECAL